MDGDSGLLSRLLLEYGYSATESPGTLAAILSQARVTRLSEQPLAEVLLTCMDTLEGHIPTLPPENPGMREWSPSVIAAVAFETTVCHFPFSSLTSSFTCVVARPGKNSVCNENSPFTCIMTNRTEIFSSQFLSSVLTAPGSFSRTERPFSFLFLCSKTFVRYGLIFPLFLYFSPPSAVYQYGAYEAGN